MRKVILLALGLLVSGGPALAGSIYKCTTDQGVVFSQSPCAPDAVQLQKKKRVGQSTRSDGGSASAGEIDAALFEEIGAASAGRIVATVGEPAAKYTHDGREYWLYPNAVREKDGRRTSPELIVENRKHLQTNWLAEDVMMKSVEAAQSIDGWSQPGGTRPKSFSVGDTMVMGRSKSEVVGKLGEPDAKRVFDGQEVWEYREVQMAADTPQTLTIYLTFEGDIVARSAGN